MCVWDIHMWKLFKSHPCFCFDLWFIFKVMAFCHIRNFLLWMADWDKFQSKQCGSRCPVLELSTHQHTACQHFIPCYRNCLYHTMHAYSSLLNGVYTLCDCCSGQWDAVYNSPGSINFIFDHLLNKMSIFSRFGWFHCFEGGNS